MVAMIESLQELGRRFLSEKNAGDPRREADRIDRDPLREVFARAEAFARVGPPINATLDPVTSPENVQMRLTSSVDDVDRMPQRSMAARGSSRGLEAGKNALIQEAGWDARAAEAIKMEAESGNMTEGQFMRIVESELANSETSGKVQSTPVPQQQPAQQPANRREEPQQPQKGAFDAVEDLIHSRRGGRR